MRIVAALTWATLVTALALRLAPACIGRSWSIDELITRNTARLPVWKGGALDAPHPASHSIVSFCLHDTGPGPLVYLLDGALARWAEPLGREWLLRLPGVVAGMLAAAGAFVCGRRWFAGLAAAPAMAVMIGLGAPCIAWSTGARGYAWAVLLALGQMDLLVWLGRSSGAADKRMDAARWMLFCLLAVAGYFLHAFHAAFTLACLAGLVYTRATWRATRIARVAPVVFWGGIALAALAAVAWTVPWLARATKGLPGGARGPFLSQIMTGIIGGQHGAPFVAAACASFVVAVVLAWVCHARPRRAPAIAGIVSVAAAWILYGALRARFFPDARYFHFLAAPAAWLLGCMCTRSEMLVRHRAGARAARAAAAAMPALLAALLLPSAVGASRNVTSDWAAAMRWLKPRMAPTDIVICGPNADGEIFTAYAQAADLPATSIRWFNDTAGRSYDAWNLDGLKAVLAAPNRVWFVTSFWGHVRPAPYWRHVSEHFGGAARIPGRFEIVIHCRPAVQASPR